MKTIQLNAKEYETFKTLANKLSIMFTFFISKGLINIEADADMLEQLGY